MARNRETVPPRAIAPGDVVAAYCEELGEWTAAQVTDLDPGWRTAGVLGLDWSGPEPHSVDDIGEPVPLRLTHHAHSGRLNHCNYNWLLPRGFKVVGRMPVLHEDRSNAYSAGWNIGHQLARQRSWDRDERSSYHPGDRSFLGVEIAGLARSSGSLAELWQVSIDQVDSLDCDHVLALFPNIVRLRLSGNLGILTGSASLNRLSHLKTLSVNNLFGMSETDCLSPAAVPKLEMLSLHSVPAEYATATEKSWTPEIPNGTLVEISSPRKPDWVAENRNNPLREWDGRDRISAARYRKAVAQYRATRRAVLAQLTAPAGDVDGSRFSELGRQFGEAFNRLDGRTPFIETEEREELFDAIDAIVNDAEVEYGRTFANVRQHLIAGIDGARDW